MAEYTPEEHEAIWNRDWPQWNTRNLDTEGVRDRVKDPITGYETVLVHQKHPIITLLSHNAESIGVQIEHVPKIDGEWYRMTGIVLDTCCRTLRTRVLSRFQKPPQGPRDEFNGG